VLAGRDANVDLRTTHDANAAHFDMRADDIFARIAGRYDLLCDLFSLGLHRLWKRRVANLIAATPWRSMLDAAAGTGDIALRLAKFHPERCRSGSIIVSDISAPMLAIAEQRTATLRAPLVFRSLDAHAMPEIEAASMDLYSISLALKICDRHRVFAEALRVLRPGGTFISLEASAIRSAWLQRLYLVYMRLCMPLIGWIATSGDSSAYLYLLRGIEAFPDAAGLAEEMRSFGFEDVAYERLTLGIVAIHVARKPDGQRVADN
jgi:demethylmenaquinone methyltransferase / 2-methoxy-6-polyprenyl-1,4-benzoquinol methylase